MIKIYFSDAKRKRCSKCDKLLNAQLFYSGSNECCFCKNTTKDFAKFWEKPEPDEVDTGEFYPQPDFTKDFFVGEDNTNF